MKKFIFGLILAFFTLTVLPAQANAPDDGVKTEIVKANAFDFNVSMEVSLEVPQILFDNSSVYRAVELWNYNFQKTPADLNISKKKKNQFYSWRYRNIESVNLKTNFKNKSFIHIDPGNLFF
jgi:hypothetical protein